MSLMYNTFSPEITLPMILVLYILKLFFKQDKLFYC